jgi:hypothetical protein
VSHRSKHRRLVVVTAVLVPLLHACHSWRPTDVSPRRYISDERPASVRLMLTDGTLVHVESPEIIGEFVVGETGRGVRPDPLLVPPEARESMRRGLSTITTPLEQVVAVEARHLSPVRTGVAISVAVGAVVGTLLAVFSNETHLQGCSPTGC